MWLMLPPNDHGVVVFPVPHTALKLFWPSCGILWVVLIQTDAVAQFKHFRTSPKRTRSALSGCGIHDIVLNGYSTDTWCGVLFFSWHAYWMSFMSKETTRFGEVPVLRHPFARCQSDSSPSECRSIFIGGPKSLKCCSCLVGGCIGMFFATMPRVVKWVRGEVDRAIVRCYDDSQV